ncbi:glycosyltransferase [Salinithrix halophila]|uniref:Glycosyltransferase n=1 Tax=Salinithrix halophila TaxID=1485204 RepID=A0ABV8JNP3_9BACL
MNRGSKKRGKNGVSIIVCTKRPQCIDRIFNNYRRQAYKEKELIIVLNHNRMDFAPYRLRAKDYQKVRVYQLPEVASLGACLNFGVGKAQYPLVAKFDDDDYYSSYYLLEAVRAMSETGADVVGKRTMYVYLREKKLLLIRRPGIENRFSQVVAGATLVAKQEVFRKVRFPDSTLGECLSFLRGCRKKGFKIYSTSRYNFVAYRRQDHKSHTWQIPYPVLIRQYSRIVSFTRNYKKWADKPIL